jgi:hypothetical protein
MQLAYHKGGTCKMFKSEGNSVGRPRRKCEYNIKMDIKDIIYEGTSQIQLVQDTVAGSCPHDHKFIFISHLPHACSMFSQSHLPLLDHCTVGLKVGKFLAVQFFYCFMLFLLLKL